MNYRPHVTPLVGVWVDDSFAFCTGPDEQKARNLASGTAVVLEGNAERVTGKAELTALADAYREKYGEDWDFAGDDEIFNPEGTRP